MKTITALVVALLALSQFAEAQGGKSQALKWVFTLVTGAGAAKAFGNADQAHAVFQQKDAIAARLKNQGVDPINGAVFSLYFTLNGDVSSVYWADIINKPDIYALVQIEGDGDYLVPAIQYEYAGQPIIENLFHRIVPAGRRILVHIMDDDSFSNTVWNNILQTSVSYNVTADVSCKPFLKAKVEAGGKVRLLDRNMELDAADYIATAEFTAPNTQEDRWVANGVLRDSSNREVGKLQFGQVWRSHPEVLSRATEEADTAHSDFVFWCVLGGVGIVIFGKLIFSRTQNAKSRNA
jgi:hypothetical protein